MRNRLGELIEDLFEGQGGFVLQVKVDGGMGRTRGQFPLQFEQNRGFTDAALAIEHERVLAGIAQHLHHIAQHILPPDEVRLSLYGITCGVWVGLS